MSNESMTPRQRMLAAYRKEPVDRTPVAPEFWYYVPARLMGLDMIEFGRVPHWQALLHAFRHYGCDGWGITGPGRPPPADATTRSESRALGKGQQLQTSETLYRGRRLVSRQILDPREPAWAVERPVKDVEHDWPAMEELLLWDPDRADWAPVLKALETVGEDYLLEVAVGSPFTDFYGGVREGGFEQLIADLQERQSGLRASRARYTDWLCRLTRAVFRQTPAPAVFIGCSWACNSLLGPRLWREWDKPVIAAVAEAAHEEGGLVHVHFHGRCMACVTDFAEIGVDCVCPFERPPGGDVTDLREVKRRLGGVVTMNGNVHTVETLIRGRPEDADREVREILEAWAGEPGLIVGTGDQVGGETPEANILAMIEAVKRHG